MAPGSQIWLRSFRVPDNTGVGRTERDEGGMWRLLSWNDTAHLEGDG